MNDPLRNIRGNGARKPSYGRMLTETRPPLPPPPPPPVVPVAAGVFGPVVVSVTLLVLLLLTTFAGGVGLLCWLVAELVVVVPTLAEPALALFATFALFALPFRLTLVPWLAFWLRLLFALFRLALLLLLLFWLALAALLLAWFTVVATAGLLLGPLLLLLFWFWFWLLLGPLLLLLLLLLFACFWLLGDGVGL